MRLRLVRFSKREKLWALVVIMALAGAGGAGRALLGGTPAPVSVSDIELQRGLVGWWKLDGNGKDSTPYADNATAVGSPAAAADREGSAASAVSFNGTSQYYTIPNSPTLQVTGSQTISEWLYPNSFSSRKNPYGKAYGGEGTITQETSGLLNYYYGTNGGNNTPYTSCSSLTTLALNTWSQVTIVRDLTAMTLTWYINGQQTNQCTAPYAAATASTNPVTIGHDYAGYYAGSIDDVREYNRALSAGEVAALHDEYNPGLAAATGQNGLVGWWKMDGNAKDSTPYGNNGTVNGATLAADREGRANTAYSFSGTSYVTLPAASILETGTFTYCAWINPTNVAGTTETIIGPSASGGPQFRVSSAKLQLLSSSIVSIATSTGSVTQSVWSHACVSYDASGNYAFYINGAPSGSGTNLKTLTLTGNFLFGAKASGSSEQYHGVIDDARIYNRVLSADEISNLYHEYDSQVSLYQADGNGNSVNLGQGLLGYWAFNGNARDSTPYADNLTVHGAPSLTTDREGRANSAYSVVDTNNDYFTVPAGSMFNGAGGLTYNIWLMRTAVSTGSQWPEILGANNTHVYYGIRSQNYGDNLTFEYGTSPYSGAAWGAISIKNPIPLNQWHMFTITYDGSTLKSYYDGSFVTSQASITLNPSFGGIDILSGGNFNGSVDDVRIWNRALTASEVSALYNLYN